MFTKVFKVMALLLPVFLPTESFWWRTSSTEAPTPAPPVMKQIPLTYFRTYTYQQPLGSSSVQLPLLSSTDYITNLNAISNAPYFNPMMPVIPMGLPTSNEIPVDTRPLRGFGNYNMVRSLGPVPPETTSAEPTTTTTTTTTTTPEPTTTTTTEPATAVPVETSSSASPVLPSDSFLNLETTFPAFNRKAFTNHFNINYNRPVYPYPEYSISKPNALNEKNQAPTNIEFVPCMCPVSISHSGFHTGYQTASFPVAGNPASSIIMAQGRTNVEPEASLDMPLANNALNAELKTVEENSNLPDDLQVVQLSENEEAGTSSQIL